ncbi:variant erythrocyte surface antigen-1 family protein [Babesia caballi]|uniref:Variant erythrocyte surface antigen-1 family protein n=1 Tax=Babesia caballi TaxID=5871 RepID=A0AAV4LRR6_BABCB|nr:variant erythrocyte surface antigen-1 family protein [Babesia caballi]
MTQRTLTDCPSNFKEAIDWILRVTGKDGGSGDDGTTELAKEVQKLLKNVETSTIGFRQQEFEQVKNALIQGIQELIESLSGCLATLIGYQNGTITIERSGIASPNDPRERLGDAVLGFLAGLIESLVKFRGDVGTLSGVNVDQLKSALGKGRAEVDTAIGKMQKLKDNKSSNNIKNLVTALSGVQTLKNTATLQQFSQNASEYLKKVLEEVENDGNFQSIRANVPFQGGNKSVTFIFQKLCSSITALIRKFALMNGKPFSLEQGGTGLSAELGNVKQYSAYFNPGQFKRVSPPPQSKTIALISALHNATSHFLAQVQKPCYTSSYPSTATWDGHQKPTYAMIFLGCIPLFYYGITYLCWQCRSNGGEWYALNFNATRGGYQSLRYFMAAMGFDISQLSGNTGQKVMGAVAGKLTELSSDTGTEMTSYPQFLAKLHKSLTNVLKTRSSTFSSLNGHTMAALIFTTSMYFQHKQRQRSINESKPPSSIRGILYWMSALTITPQFSDLLAQLRNVVPSNFKVAVSGSSRGGGFQALTADDLSGHLIPACILCPNILGLIQGAGDSADSEPWLHGLFGNTLNLSYPSGLDLFRALCDYVYAVQFQLSFLVQMCMSNSVNGGWQNCRYGRGVKPISRDNPVKSWICPIISGCNGSKCQHNSSNHCKHYDECGKGPNHSPLQAFLTDCLEGFRHSTSDPLPSRSPNYPNHYGNHPKGFMCHVPMGFTSETVRAGSSTGNAIYFVLRIFSGSSIDPFRKLCENLVCLTKRTPKTLGDLFGFYWHFCNQVFNKRNIMDDFAKLLGELKDFWTPWNIVKKISEALSSQDTAYANLRTSMSFSSSTTGLSRSFKALQSSEALFFFLFQAGIPNALDGLARHCHKEDTNVTKSRTTTVIKHNGPSTSTSTHKCSETPNDLWSIHQGVSDPNTKHKMCSSKKCGGYLNSLTLASGAAFATDFAATYLSWLVYLTEEFYEWFSEFLGDFRRLTCDNCINKSVAACESHTVGKHGDDCTCKSVVWCSGVLALFYQYGFNFTSTSSLNGQHFQRQTLETVRTCQNFAQQLQGVLAKDDTTPLWNLIKAIDKFLFYVRLGFLLLIGSVWTLAFVIIFKILIIKLDLLHIRSHLHLPSSHSVAPIAPLTIGKAADLTKLKYFIL